VSEDGSLRGSTFYHFVSRWRVNESADAAYAVLYEVSDYPRWWPEVKEARQVEEDRLHLRTRSLLPYDITFTLVREIADPRAHVLQARVTGDLEGAIRWTIAPQERGTLILWDQRVTANKALLKRFAPVARPAFIANHALMMRHGHAGLRVFLAGYRLGRSQAG
jgi:hypothetical protein